MSTEGTVVDATSGPPDDQQGLQEEIERTREHLGETVEALVAKADVKARAQDEAGRLIGRLKAKVLGARRQAAARAVEARRQAADKTAGPRQKATVQGRHVRRQVADKTAAPLQQAASLGGSVAEQVKPPGLQVGQPELQALGRRAQVPGQVLRHEPAAAPGRGFDRGG